MWSGPRNISTAMMRSWGSRADTAVTDEPLYAHYLKATGVEHPGREEVMARHETDWRKVVATLTGPVPGAKPLWYQKHMSHHLLPGIDRAWLAQLTNCFLIRDPAAMLVSLSKVTPNPTLTDTGLPQQVELFEAERARTGRVPPVVDSRDVQDNPRGTLTRLCAAIGVPFDEAMLRWKPGTRPEDGVWGRHWYGNVYRTVGFEPYKAPYDALPGRLAGLLGECRPLYERLHAQRLTA